MATLRGLVMPDVVGAAREGFAYGREQKRQRTLAEHMQGAIGGDKSALSAIYSADPETGFKVQQAATQQQEQGLAQEDRRRERLGQMARQLTKLPPEMRGAAYKQLIPELQTFGLQTVPPEYTPEVDDVVRQVAEAFGASEEAEQFTLGPGSKRFDASGNLVAEVPFAPANAQYVDVPDGQGGTLKMLLDPRSQQFTMPNYGGQSPAPMPADLRSPVGQGGNQFAFLSSIPGVTVTSGKRTPERNAQVGGKPNSYHLTDQARDILPPRTPEQAALIRQQAAANGLEVIDEGDHWHLEPAPGRATAQAGRLGYNPPKSQRDDKAPAGYRYTAAGDLEPIPGGPADPNAPRPMTPAQRQKAETTMRKERQMLTANEAGIDQTVQLIDNILSKRDDFGGVTGMGRIGARIPGTDWADLAAAIDTLRGRSAFGALQQMRANSPTGGALGSVTERELSLLQNAETQLQDSQSPESLAKALENYRNQLLQSKARMREGLAEAYQDVSTPAPAEPATQDDDDLIGKYL